MEFLQGYENDKPTIYNHKDIINGHDIGLDDDDIKSILKLKQYEFYDLYGVTTHNRVTRFI